jgi:hypothetical protein
VSKGDGEGGNGSPEVVDFDALHAALGELPPPPTSSNPVIVEAPARPAVTDSHGRSSATYASARPHVIPQARLPAPGEQNEPAVIVRADDTIQTGPPQMTIPMGSAPFAAAPGRHPNIGPPTPGHPFTPPPFPVQAVPQAQAQHPSEQPMHPHGAPLPRRPRTPTIVVRTRGPSALQKALAFVMMLIVVVAAGIVYLTYYRPHGINIDFGALLGGRTAAPAAAPTPAPTPVTTPLTVPASASAAPSASASAAPSASASAAPSASASAKKSPSAPKH